MTLTNLPFLEIIQWLEDDPDVMMWKFPDRDQEIKNGARLIVRESQAALLLNEGKIADRFEAGTHPLSTENIPLLTRLKGWQYGFKSPFKVDIYYFAVRQFINLKWGTPAPVMMLDPHFGQVRVRGFGTYNVRIVRPESFFREYAGTASHITIQGFERKLRDFIAPRFAEALATSGVSVLDIFRNLSAINDKTGPLISQYFDPFGIEITDFTITSASLPDEVNKYYDTVTGMNMVGDMEKFRQFNTAIAVGQENSAVNMATQQAMGIGIIMDQVNQTGQQPVGAKEAAGGKSTGASQTPAAPPAQADLTQQLQTLKSFFDQGLIDEQEYKAKKADILSKL